MPDIIQDTYELLEASGLLAVQHALEFARSDFFYRDALVDFFLWRQTSAPRQPTPFIDYAKASDYCADDMLHVTLSRGSERKLLALPYKEMVNFVQEPDAQIVVQGELTQYHMPVLLSELTEQNLTAFRRAKKKAVDSPVLRISSFRRVAPRLYECALQRATYFDQARTNLTIDYPLDRSTARTLREFDCGPDRFLKPLEESALVNSIGISAVIFLTSQDTRYFFMKVRNASEGLFEDVFGSVSGVVQVTESHTVAELVSYLQHEIRRELSLETGIDNDSSRIKQVLPLAFTRELARGGKPQFFFLIELQNLDRKRFRQRFRRSMEGLDEFYDNRLRNKADFPKSLGLEFATNLVYAHQYFQARRLEELDPIILM